MQRSILAAFVIVAAAGLLVWTGGCPTGTNTGDNGTSGDNPSSLTSGEQDAAQAAALAAESLAHAITTAQSPTGGDNQSSLTLPTGSLDATFGICPEVTLSVSNDGVLLFDMQIDFGSTPCAPMGSANGYACSGSASGTFSQAQQTLSLTFTNLSCEGATLTGGADVSYERNSTSVDLDGDWELTLSDSAGTVTTDGDGAGSYDFVQYVTSVDTFDGTMSIDGDTFDLVMSGIKMSFPTYERFMPYAGELTLSGDTIRTYTIRFDAESPTTGVVAVSINGSPFVDVILYSLEE